MLPVILTLDLEVDAELATAQERHSAELQEMWRAENEDRLKV